MLSFGQTRSTVLSSGLWDGDRAETHAFQLPTEPYPLSLGHLQQLRSLGPALYACLQGVSRMFTIASDPALGHPQWWRSLKRLLQTQVPDYFGNVMHLHPNQLPFLLKVDLVEDQEGKLWLVEIDAGNPRALGHSVLLRHLALQASDSLLPGVIPAIQEAVALHGDALFCMVSERERWYRPAFDMLATELSLGGLPTRVLQEGELSVDKEKRLVSRTGQPVDAAVTLYAPLVLDSSVAVRTALFEQYCAGGLKFLMPPKPFLGSKAIMALLCNAAGDVALEGVLRSYVSEKQLVAVREHLPETRILDTSSQNMSGPTVLKSLVASGTKGVYFSSDLGYRGALAGHLKQGRGTAILQAEVPGKRARLGRFTPEGRAVKDERYLRFIAHFSGKGVEDVFVTACRDKKVHGGKEAILTGCMGE